MTEAIIVALITAASAVVCQIVIASNSRKTMQQAQYDSQKLIEYKIDKLSERVDKHNSVIARTYKLEQDYALIDLNDECVLTTMGKYADLIPDEGFRKDILKYLIPMQMGEAEIPKVKYKDVKKERSSDDWYRY